MDIDILLWFQSLRDSLHGALDTPLLLITELGEAIIPMMLAFALYWCLNKTAGLNLLFTCNIGDFFNGVAKLTATVYRPWIRDSRIQPVEGALSGATGYSFPSGHSTKAVTAYGGLAYSNKTSRWFKGCMTALIILIMVSRCYLGVHTPQDVLVGAALGGLTVWLVKQLLRWVDHGNRDLWLAAAATAVGALSIVYAALKAYPIDMADGVLLADPVKMQADHFSATGAVIGLLWGWVWERRGIRFSLKASAWQLVLRFISGMVIAFGLLYTLLRHGMVAPLGKPWANLIGTALALFYAVAVHPFLFTRWEQRMAQRGGKQKTTPVDAA